MLKHFSQDGLLMYSKSCDYFKTNPITLKEIEKYYEILSSEKILPNYVSRPAHKVCCIYYLAKENPNYKISMYQEIMSRLNGGITEINDNNLLYLYNIIDFIEKYYNNDKSIIKQLYRNLEKFNHLKKTYENYFLYKYYRGLLLFRNENIEEANSEYLELLVALREDVNQRTPFIEFIQLKNDLFNLRLKNTDLSEQYLLLDSLFNGVQSKDKLLSIKIGFGLYENLFRQAKFKECVNVLKKVDSLVKTLCYSGELKNGYDYYFYLSSRLGSVGTILNDINIVEDAIKSLDDVLTTIEKEKSNNKLNLLKKGYSFVNTILKIIHLRYVDKASDFAKKFKSELFPSNKEQIRQENFIINKNNYNNYLISINGLLNYCNTTDNMVFMNTKNLIDNYLNTIKGNNKLNTQNSIQFIIGAQGIICNLAETYCLSHYRNNEIRNSIINYASCVLNFAKSYKGSENLINNDYIKSALIRIYSCYTHLYIYKKDYESVRKSLTVFDFLCSKLNINENTPYFELSLKIKGDYYFADNKIGEAITCYENAVKLMKESNPRKPIIYFNLGCIYYFYNNKNGAIDNMNRCINCFNIIEKEKRTFYILKSSLNRKIDIAKNILAQINGN